MSFASIVIALPFIGRKFGYEFSVGLALASPIIGMYCHLYDLAPFVIFAILFSTMNITGVTFWCLVNMSLIFRGPQTGTGFVLLLFVNLYYFLAINRINASWTPAKIRFCFLGFVTYFITTRSLMSFIHDEQILRASLISAITVFAFSSIMKSFKSQGVIK
jgi:hypothetical protein